MKAYLQLHETFKRNSNNINIKNNIKELGKLENMKFISFHLCNMLMYSRKMLKNKRKNTNMNDIIPLHDKWTIICKILPSIKNYPESEYLSLRYITFIENRLIGDFYISRNELYNMYINEMMRTKYTSN